MLILPVILALAAVSSPAGGRGVEGPTFSGSVAVSSERQSNSKNAAYLVCYENADWSGDEVRLREYAPYLSLYNFNNRARSCCINGM